MFENNIKIFDCNNKIILNFINVQINWITHILYDNTIDKSGIIIKIILDKQKYLNIDLEELNNFVNMSLIKTKIELYNIISFDTNKISVNIKADNYVYSKIKYDSNDDLILELKYGRHSIECKNIGESEE